MRTNKELCSGCINLFGQGILQYYVSVHWCLLILMYIVCNFRGLKLPQMVLFHVISGLVEGFMRSMFRRERTELAMTREINWHQRSIQDPPILVKNAELSIQLVNAPDMYFMRTTMSRVCYFLSISLSHTQFQENLDPFQMFVLANYLRDSHETRSLLEEKLELLLIGTPGHMFVRTLLKHLDDCDQAFYYLYYMNVDMFDEYFAYGSIDDWHIKRIDTPTLLNQAKVIIQSNLDLVKFLVSRVNFTKSKYFTISNVPKVKYSKNCGSK